MPSGALKFVHSSDFHLEQPLTGVAELRDEWKDWFVDAPYHAAKKVFDVAIQEEADFLLLAGDLIDPGECAPRAYAFLLEQFQRMHDEGIAVYWAGGNVDRPDVWPDSLRLPPSVQVFPAGRVEELTHLRDETPVAAIFGQSRAARGDIRVSDFDHEDSRLFGIAVASGRVDGAALGRQRINFWALGGEHNRSTPTSSPYTVHYSGSPQGRAADEIGSHGCTVVTVEKEHTARMRLVPTDVVRWQRERVVVPASSTYTDLERLIAERGKKLMGDAEERPQLVTWLVDGVDRWTLATKRAGIVEKLTERLREDLSRLKYPIWTVGVELVPPVEQADAWFDEDSIRGDFLRAIREWHNDPTHPIDVEPMLPEKALTDTWEVDLRIADQVIRREVLDEAAVLGVELLSGDDPGPVETQRQVKAKAGRE